MNRTKQNAKVIKQLLKIKEYSKNMHLAAEKWDAPWQTLIAIILSARTRDETTIKVCKDLFSKYSLNSLAHASFKEIADIIRPVNFYRNKTKAAISCSKILIEKYLGQVPRNLDILISLPGVGRKTANVFLSEFNQDTIAVDTHVAYISQRLEWVKNTNPHKIEKELEKLFPKKYWKKINPYLVRFGKTYTSRKQKNKLLDSIKRIK